MAIPTRTPLLLLLALAGVAACITGCTAESGIFRSPGGSPVHVRVLVRDHATHRPIEGAAVAAETTSRDHAFSAASILGQTGPSSSAGTTDHTGLVTVTVLDEREFRIVVWATGRAPVVFGPAQLRLKTREWITPEVPPASDSDGRIQIKLAGEDDQPTR
jgi:hypothetical protein